MPKKLTTALLALLTFATVLAVVPLAQPAAAHTQTKQYCAYDPFAGNQCWTENVSHSHDPPTEQELWGKPPAPCPSGTTGTPPNCHPIPSDNSNHDKDKGGTDKTEPDTTEPDETEPDSGDSDSGDSDSGDSDSGSSDSDSDSGDSTEPDETEPDETEPGTTYTGPSTGTATTDPCGDYADDLIDALSRVDDGTNTPPTLPTRPEQCKGADWIQALKNKLKGLSKDLLRQLYDLERDTSELSDDVATALRQEIERLWDATPVEAQAAIVTVASGLGCAALIAVIVKTTVASGGAAAPAWITWIAAHKATVGTANLVCTGAVSAAIAYVDRVTGDETNAVPDDDAPDDGTDGEDGTDGDGTDGDGDSTDDPSLEGSWHDVRERHAPPDNEAQRELFRRWSCQKYDDLPPSRCG